MNDKEIDQTDLLKLCWLLNKQCKAESELQKAKWRHEYCKKQRIKYGAKDQHYTDWVKKTSEAKLEALGKHEQLLKVRDGTWQQIVKALNTLSARIINERGRIHSLYVGYHNKKVQMFDVKQIAEMADEYEANKILTNALK